MTADAKIILSATDNTSAAFNSLKGNLGAAKGHIDSLAANVSNLGGLLAASIGGLSIAGFASMVKGGIESAAVMHDLAIQTGTTVESLSGLASIGKFSGISAEAIGSSMNKLAKNMAGATEESRGAGKAIEALGIDFNAFKQLDPAAQMQTVSKALEGFQDGAGKGAVMMAMFGKEGAQLLPMMKDLAVAGDLQAKVTKEQAAMADNFSDNLIRVRMSGEGWKKELTMGMLPALDTAAQAFVNVMNGSGGLRDEVKKLSADGSIKEWTSSAITGLTYVMDAGAGVVRTFESVGKGLGALAAMGAAAVTGDFGQIKTIWQDFNADMDKRWTDKTFGQRMREQIEQLNANATATKAAGDAAEKAKPKLDFTNIMEKNAKAAKAAKEEITDLGKIITANELAVNKWLDANEKTLDSLIAGNEKLREQNEVIGLTTAETNALTLARQDAAIAQAELNLVEAQNIEGNAARVAQIEREINLLKQRRELLATGQEKTAAVEAGKAAEKAAKDAAAEWQKYADQINQSLTDALMDAFMSGKGFGKTFVDGITSMFRAMVLRPTISAIVGSVTGMPGTAGASSGSGITSLYSGMTSASSLYGVGSQVVGGTMSLGNAGGTLFANATGTGLDGLLVANGAYGTAAAGSAGSALASLAAAAPYIAAFVGAAYLLDKYVVGQGTAHMGGGSQYSAAGGTQTTGTWVPESTSYGYWNTNPNGAEWVAQQTTNPGYMTGSSTADFAGAFTSVGYSEQAVAMTTALTQGIVGILDSTATAFGKQAGYTAASSFADDSSSDGAWGSLVIANAIGQELVNWRDGSNPYKTFGDGTAGTDQYKAAIAADVRNALYQIDLPAWATDMLAALGDAPDLTALSTGVAQINLVAKALDVMGDKLVGFSAMSDATVSALIKAAGGFEALATSASTYYDNFYSEAEKSTFTLTEVAKTLNAVNLNLPTSREGFRALLEAQQAIGNAEGVAALLKVAGAYASVIPAAEAAAAAVDTVAEALGRTAADIANNMKSLYGDKNSAQIDSLRAKGLNDLADAQQRAFDTQGWTDAEIAIYDYNTTLRQQTAALIEANNAAQSITDQRNSLINEANLLNGSLTQREMESWAIDESNMALFHYVNQLKDQKTATEEAAAASKAAADAMSAATRTVTDEVKRLRGELVSASPGGQAYLMAQFASTTAQARAGSVTAMEQLPEISRALEAAAALTATSSTDLARTRAWLAGSLGTTAGALPGDVFSTVPGTTAGYTSAQAAGTAQLEALIQKLTTEVEAMKYGVQATATHTSNTNRLIERLTPDGDALAVREAAAL